MNRTFLTTLEISENSDVQSYADEILEVLQDEGLPVLTVVPWGQVSAQPAVSSLGQMPLPTVPEPPQPNAFQSVSPIDPWLPG